VDAAKRALHGTDRDFCRNDFQSRQGRTIFPYLGSGPINRAIEASKWRTYRAKVVAGKAGCLSKIALVRDGSHFVVPKGFDQNGPELRRIVLKYQHIPAPILPALSRFASNLDGAINRS
jgi:hypothetical protein